MKAGRDLYGAILARDDERFLGCVGAHRLPGDDPDLGIWVREDAWGNGYGREAVEGILAWASARTIAPVFGYPVDERNVPSRRIATSLGGYRVGDPWTITTPDGRTLRVILYAIPRK
jgi:RimJ/RimL family protein N-acetyltransferase